VGAFAAPPYYCAQNQLSNALTSCTILPSFININNLWSATSNAFSQGQIDNPNNLQNDRVWLFTGTQDTVVYPGVVQVSAQYYQKFVPSNENFLVGNISAEHAWITDNYGNSCSYLGSPYINNCGFDASLSLLRHIYNTTTLKPRTSYVSGNMKTFNQGKYTQNQVSPSSISLSDQGFVYVPSGCQSGAVCKLHVSFHGCQQSYSTIDDVFIVHNGLNEWAESNNIIVLYPQATTSTLFPSNPEGCFDWWGYTNGNYATKVGPQVATVGNMVAALGGPQ